MAVTGTRVLVGRYVLRDVIGTGGMATVWRATDEVLGREVAVKVLSPQFAADPGFAARFEREARHVAGLSHPSVVTVFDCGVDGSLPFIVMELIGGRTLRRVLDEAGGLPAGDAVRIAAAVCDALEVAHAAGVVHRDITPANIVLGRGGEVKVLDFGIARIDGAEGSTRTMGVLGTAAYLSPEQASGYPAGPQADLYSLGCVLFEMLTGTPPFAAESAVGLAYRQVHDDPGPPSARRPGLPVWLDQITARLLAKDPAARPPGAAAARAGLLAAMTPQTTAVLPPLAGDPVTGQPSQHQPSQHRSGQRRSGQRSANRGGWRPRPAEAILGTALAAALAALAVVLLTGSAGRTGATPPRPGATSPAATPGSSAQGGREPARNHGAALPPAAAAAAAFVGDLQAGVADGQVTPQAGQDLFSHLQHLLFEPPGQSAQRVQDDYQQLVRVYDDRLSQGQITGRAVGTLRRALQALRTANGIL